MGRNCAEKKRTLLERLSRMQKYILMQNDIGKYASETAFTGESL